MKAHTHNCCAMMKQGMLGLLGGGVFPLHVCDDTDFVTRGYDGQACTGNQKLQQETSEGAHA